MMPAVKCLKRCKNGSSGTAMKTSVELQEAEAMFMEYASLHKMRMSSERRDILRFIFEQKRPVAPAEAEEFAAREHISRATVYNTLKLLVRANVLRRVQQDGNARIVQYEPVGWRHNRMEMRCMRCGRVVKIQDAAISDLIAAKRYSNFNYSHYTLCVYGECKLCRKSATKEKDRKR